MSGRTTTAISTTTTHTIPNKSNAAVKIYPDNDKRTQFMQWKNVYIHLNKIALWYIYHVCILSIYAEQVISYITYSSIYVIHCSSNAAFENLFTHSNSITISSSRLRCCCRITLHQNENFYSIRQRNDFTGGVIITKLYDKGARSIYRIVYFQKTMKDFQCWFFFSFITLYVCNKTSK